MLKFIKDNDKEDLISLLSTIKAVCFTEGILNIALFIFYSVTDNTSYDTLIFLSQFIIQTSFLIYLSIVIFNIYRYRKTVSEYSVIYRKRKDELLLKLRMLLQAYENHKHGAAVSLLYRSLYNGMIEAMEHSQIIPETDLHNLEEQKNINKLSLEDLKANCLKTIMMLENKHS